MQFEDIEMLEVPDDLSVALDTHTEPISDADSESPAPAKQYPSFHQWLDGEHQIAFQFDEAAYQKSCQRPSGFGAAQLAYVTRLYKAVELLAALPIAAVPTPMRIGVVSAVPGFGQRRDAQRQEALVNGAFAALVEAFDAFRTAVAGMVSETEARGHEDLAALLACIQATWFALSERQRPEQVLEWINRYDPRPENALVDAVMYSTRAPYAHPQFWTSYLGTLLARGMFEQAALSLRASRHDALAAECPALHAIIEDLATVVGTYRSMASKGQFAEWKATVCEFRDNFHAMREGISGVAHAAIAAQIHDLLCLLSGLPKTTASFVATWYEMYGALALFQVRDDPSVYADYYRVAIAEKGSNVLSEMEQAFRDVLSQKLLRVVLAVDARDPATAAYVSKLFELKGLFGSYYADATKRGLDGSGPVPRRRVSDYLLTRHAYECLEVHDLVPVGLGILLTPVVSASEENTALLRRVVSEFLPSFECATNDDLEWALTICAKLRLTDVIRKLFLKQGRKLLKDGHLLEALNMLVGCYDEHAPEASASALDDIQHIVWNLLFQDCLLNSEPIPDELLTDVVLNNDAPELKIHPVIRQCIAPYAVLAEFFIASMDGMSFANNVSRLFHLIRFNYMPRKFVPLLLAQFLPMIPKHKFDMPQLIILTELIDAFEAHWEAGPEECNELYEFAVENVPTEANIDWRVQLGDKTPACIKDLIRDLREQVVGKIGRIYIET